MMQTNTVKGTRIIFKRVPYNRDNFNLTKLWPVIMYMTCRLMRRPHPWWKYRVRCSRALQKAWTVPKTASQRRARAAAGRAPWRCSARRRRSRSSPSTSPSRRSPSASAASCSNARPTRPTRHTTPVIR